MCVCVCMFSCMCAHPSFKFCNVDFHKIWCTCYATRGHPNLTLTLSYNQLICNDTADVQTCMVRLTLAYVRKTSHTFLHLGLLFRFSNQNFIYTSPLMHAFSTNLILDLIILIISGKEGKCNGPILTDCNFIL
jgi:hypothetical protein